MFSRNSFRPGILGDAIRKIARCQILRRNQIKILDININIDKGKAKAYQVKQVLLAIDKLEVQNAIGK
jgi:hypothetical protein